MKTKAAIAAALIIGVYFMLNTAKPRGIRNNNPLNIRENHKVDYDWVGESLFDKDLDFEEFVSPVYGIRAAARILKNYRDKYDLNTVSGIINRWAPPIENDTQAYIESVADKVGINAHEPLAEVDYTRLISAMIYHENGQQPYSVDEIQQGFEMGFYS
jgi:hypothetical protein